MLCGPSPVLRRAGFSRKIVVPLDLGLDPADHGEAGERVRPGNAGRGHPVDFMADGVRSLWYQFRGPSYERGLRGVSLLRAGDHRLCAGILRAFWWRAY